MSGELDDEVVPDAECLAESGGTPCLSISILRGTTHASKQAAREVTFVTVKRARVCLVSSWNLSSASMREMIGPASR
jgi:hypothetical protein